MLAREEGEREQSRARHLYLVRISTDGTFEVFDHVDSLRGTWSAWRINDPKLRVCDYWVKDQYEPQRWLVPAPKVVEYHHAIVSSDEGEFWVGRYAADLAARILGCDIDRLD